MPLLLALSLTVVYAIVIWLLLLAMAVNCLTTAMFEPPASA